MESTISLHGDLENNPFRHSQPMETDECICDVVRSTETEYQSRRCVLHRLESVDKADQSGGRPVFQSRAERGSRQRQATGRRSLRRDDGCCEVDAVLRSSLTPSDTRECASPGRPGRSRQRCRGRARRSAPERLSSNPLSV